MLIFMRYGRRTICGNALGDGEGLCRLGRSFLFFVDIATVLGVSLSGEKVVVVKSNYFCGYPRSDGGTLKTYSR